MEDTLQGSEGRCAKKQVKEALHFWKEGVALVLWNLKHELEGKMCQVYALPTVQWTEAFQVNFNLTPTNAKHRRNFFLL